jgi:2-amino-4-hydroxy-6-hydroxymethyldihydropteridine diphosphokinase
VLDHARAGEGAQCHPCPKAGRRRLLKPERGIGNRTPVAVYLGLGTNIGDRRANLRAALAALREEIDVLALSSIYESEPVGYADQPPFWNMVARAATPLAPAELLARLIGIEQRMGRQRSFRNAPRIIDLDILLYGDVVQADPGLQLPHPRMSERAFVLRPLTELAPSLRDPQTGELYRDVLERGTFERAIVVGALDELI